MKYKITFKTGNVGGAGTDANISLRLFGSQKITSELTLSSKLSQFEKGSIDNFYIETENIGNLTNIEIWHDNELLGADWFLNEVVITAISTKKIWYFPIYKWIKKREHIKVKAVDYSRYDIEVTTGILPGSGSKSKVQLSIIGTKSYTPFIDISQNLRKKEFKTGHTQNLSYLAEDVGKIKELKVTSSGIKNSSNWFLNRIRIKKHKNKNYISFPFYKWIMGSNVYSSSNDLIEYIVKFQTGDVAYGGTDANVFLKIFGNKGNTEDISLNELIPRNAFEAGNIDYIKLAQKDLGSIIKIKIWHDEKWPGDGWFVNKVVVKNQKSGVESEFPYYSWLDKSADPKSTIIELTRNAVKQRPFYVIAHMVNTPVYVEEALDLGSNAVEFDITPKYNDDNTFSFDAFHGFRPDFDPDKINLMERSTARTSLPEFLKNLKRLEIKYPNFSLAIYDCKLDNIDRSLLKECGKQLASMVTEMFYGLNTEKRIFTIFSVAKQVSAPFINGLTESIPKKFSPFIGFDFSMEKFQTVEKIFENSDGSNFWWGSGITSSVPKPLKHFIPQFLIAAKKRTKREIIKKIYYWTLDDPDSMARILVTKLDGIIVNDPLKLLKVLQKEEFRYTYKLADRSDNPFLVV